MDEPPIIDAPILKVFVSDGTSIFTVDAIGHDGRLWLVLRWLCPPSKEWREPERIICLSGLPYQDLRGTGQPADYSLPVPLPKHLFGDTPLLPSEEYLVVEHPHIRFRMPTVH
jgi:hypothetical protein